MRERFREMRSLTSMGRCLPGDGASSFAAIRSAAHGRPEEGHGDMLTDGIGVAWRPATVTDPMAMSKMVTAPRRGGPEMSDKKLDHRATSAHVVDLHPHRRGAPAVRQSPERALSSVNVPARC